MTLCFSHTNQTDIYNRLCYHIEQSKTDIFIETQYINNTTLFHNNQLVNVLKNNGDNGVKINILTNKSYLTNPYIHGSKNWFKYPSNMFMELVIIKHVNEISSDNISVRYVKNGYTHNKVWIFDKKIIFIGTANLDDRSLLSNRDYEIGVFIDDEILANTYLNHISTIQTTSF